MAKGKFIDNDGFPTEAWGIYDVRFDQSEGPQEVWLHERYAEARAAQFERWANEIPPTHRIDKEMT